MSAPIDPNLGGAEAAAALRYAAAEISRDASLLTPALVHSISRSAFAKAAGGPPSDGSVAVCAEGIALVGACLQAACGVGGLLAAPPLLAAPLLECACLPVRGVCSDPALAAADGRVADVALLLKQVLGIS